MDNFLKKIERILDLPYYSYSCQHDLSRLNPPPPVSIFGNSALGRLVKAAGEAMGAIPYKQRPVLPVLFGWQRQKKVWSNGLAGWQPLDEPKPYVVDYRQIIHLMLSGVTGGGKSNAITQLILSLCYFSHPDTLRVLILDPKKNFGYLKKIVKVVEKTKDIHIWISTIKKLMGLKQSQISEAGYRDINEFNADVGKVWSNPLPYDVIIIDELASILDGNPEAVEELMHLQEQGRSAGILLLLTGQRLDAQVVGGSQHRGRGKANILWSWSFAQRDATNSRIAGVDGAFKGLPPGTGILSTPREELIITTALIDIPTMKYAVRQMARQGLIFK